jgi:hypothetical protein
VNLTTNQVTQVFSLATFQSFATQNNLPNYWSNSSNTRYPGFAVSNGGKIALNFAFLVRSPISGLNIWVVRLILFDPTTGQFHLHAQYASRVEWDPMAERYIVTEAASVDPIANGFASRVVDLSNGFPGTRYTLNDLPGSYSINDNTRLSGGYSWASPAPWVLPHPQVLDRCAIVAPEACDFHRLAEEFGLPMPFDTLPVRSEDLTWVEGYGANTFSWSRKDRSTYRQTHGYHTGIDYGRVDDSGDEIPIPVQAVCDGIIIAGRVAGGNGGSTKVNTGRGFVLRCFMDDPALIDIDNDGHRNLSNIVLAYNHVKSLDGNFPTEGRIVYEGELLAETTHYYTCAQSEGCVISNYGLECTFNGVMCDESWKQPNHLHLEVFIARGFRDGQRNGIGGDGGDSIRVNPALMFASPTLNTHIEYIGEYYPIRTGYVCWTCVEVLEQPPPDFEDNIPVGTETRNDMDFGILEGQLGILNPSGDISLVEGERGLFWTRQNPPTEGVQDIFNTGPEWTTSTFANSQVLVNHLFNDPVYQDGIPLYMEGYPQPHCANIELQIGENLPITGLCELVNDDSDLDIGFIGQRG